jgi:hypothetical protein
VVPFAELPWPSSCNNHCCRSGRERAYWCLGVWGPALVRRATVCSRRPARHHGEETHSPSPGPTWYPSSSASSRHVWLLAGRRRRDPAGAVGIPGPQQVVATAHRNIHQAVCSPALLRTRQTPLHIQYLLPLNRSTAPQPASSLQTVVAQPRHGSFVYPPRELQFH